MFPQIRKKKRQGVYQVIPPASDIHDLGARVPRTFICWMLWRPDSGWTVLPLSLLVIHGRIGALCSYITDLLEIPHGKTPTRARSVDSPREIRADHPSGKDDMIAGAWQASDTSGNES